MDAFRGIAEQVTNPGMVVSPFEGMCGAPCGSYAVRDNAERCEKHGRIVSAMDGCADWTRWGASVGTN